MISFRILNENNQRFHNFNILKYLQKIKIFIENQPNKNINYLTLSKFNIYKILFYFWETQN